VPDLTVLPCHASRHLSAEVGASSASASDNADLVLYRDNPQLAADVQALAKRFANDKAVTHNPELDNAVKMVISKKSHEMGAWGVDQLQNMILANCVLLAGMQTRDDAELWLKQRQSASEEIDDARMRAILDIFDANLNKVAPACPAAHMQKMC
jgi:hypothetical protein